MPVRPWTHHTMPALPKTYDPEAFEAQRYGKEQAHFATSNATNAEPFCVMMPTPKTQQPPIPP